MTTITGFTGDKVLNLIQEELDARVAADNALAARAAALEDNSKQARLAYLLSDLFDSDSSADWDAYTGAFAISGGKLVPSTVSLEILRKNFWPRTPIVQAQFTAGSTIPSSSVFSLLLCGSSFTNINNLLMFEVGLTTGNMNIYSKIAGSYTLLTTASVGAGVATNQVRWLRACVIGEVAELAIYSFDPELESTVPLKTCKADLNTDALRHRYGPLLPGGRVGIRLDQVNSGFSVDEFKVWA